MILYSTLFERLWVRDSMAYIGRLVNTNHFVSCHILGNVRVALWELNRLLAVNDCAE